MTPRIIAERVVEHTVLHWDSIEDRENTIEQAVFLMTNRGEFRWCDLSNAILRKELPSEVSGFMRRIVERLRKEEVKGGELTKSICEFAEACVNDEGICELGRKMRETVDSHFNERN